MSASGQPGVKVERQVEGLRRRVGDRDVNAVPRHPVGRLSADGREVDPDP